MTGESKTEITCRAVGPIKTPDERPFEEYVRKALIDFSSTEGKWSMAMTVKSTTGRSLTVANDYSYETSFIATRPARARAAPTPQRRPMAI